MSQSGLRGEAENNIREPTESDIYKKRENIAVDVDLPFDDEGEITLSIDMEEVLNSVFEEEKKRRENELITNAFNRHTDADIIVIDRASSEVIMTADSSASLASKLQNIDYNPNDALIARRDEYQS